MDLRGAESRLRKRLEALSLGGALIAAVIGAAGLLGWMLEVASSPSLHRTLTAVKPNAALAFTLLGLALFVQRQRGDRAKPHVTLLLAVVVGLGGVTLLEYFADWDAGIDELWFRDHAPLPQAPGRMSPPTAANLVLLGVSALLALRAPGARFRAARQALALLASVSALIALLGYLYGAEALYRIGPFVSVSLPSALAVLAAGVSLLVADVSYGLGALLRSPSGAGSMMRTLLPAALLLPTLLGWVRLKGQQAGLYGTELGLSLFASSSIVCFTALLWWSAENLKRAEVETEGAAQRLRALADVSRAFGALAIDYHKLLESVVDSAASLIGDGCLVTLLAPDGETLMNAANAHRDPNLAVDYRTYLASSGINKLGGNTIAARVARTGQKELVAHIAPEAMVAQIDESLRPLVARLNVHSFIVVPIRASSRLIGTMSLVRSRPGMAYTEEDATLLEDLADRAGLAIENARLYDQLERRVEERTHELAELNQELEAFGYSIAHDLRAPLRAINGFSSALLEDLGPTLDEQGKKYLGFVVENADRMAQLIDGLLELSRIQRGELQTSEVDLSALSRGILASLEASDPAHRVMSRVDDGLVARGDERLLTALLQNLIGNAWKFSRDRQGARIELGKRGSSSSPTFFVRDNGAGFDMAHAHRLFSPFQRLHSAAEYEGTGIGLATVQRIVRRHGGKVWAESSRDCGATFFFTLPGTSREERLEA